MIYNIILVSSVLGSPGGSYDKESVCSAGDLGLIPGLGRFPWKRARQPTPGYLPGESLQAEVSGGESKVRCCKEQYCVGTWNVRSMNQGKLDVIKQETVRVNIDILGISELKWMGMGEFDSDDHYVYYCGHVWM